MKLPVFDHMDDKACNGCELCARVCGAQAIAMVEDATGFRYPSLDADRCTHCGLCAKKCPVLRVPEPTPRKCVTVGYALDESVVTASSSGGFFGLIATALLEQGNWSVAGVAWDERFNGVSHTIVDRLEQLPVIQRSKYCQSVKGDVYREVAQRLQAGRNVLFCGCPCEVAAMVSYVPDALLERLYTLDFVCQGPTSTKAWREYLSRLERRYGVAVADVNMRYAIGAWIPQYLRIRFVDGRVFCRLLYQTALGDAIRVMQRPSCFQCSFAGEYTRADLRLGDYHGADPSASYYHESGISIAIAHSHKGLELLVPLQGRAYLENADFDELARHNPRMVAPWEPRPGYDTFVTTMARSGLFAASRAVLPWKQRVLRRLSDGLRGRLKLLKSIVMR